MGEWGVFHWGEDEEEDFVESTGFGLKLHRGWFSARLRIERISQSMYCRRTDTKRALKSNSFSDDNEVKDTIYEGG